MIMIYYCDKKLKKRIACHGSWYIKTIKKKNNINFMYLAQKMPFLQDVFQNDRHCACLTDKSLSY